MQNSASAVDQNMFNSALDYENLILWTWLKIRSVMLYSYNFTVERIFFAHVKEGYARNSTNKVN